MTLLDIAAFLFGLVAVFGYINHRYVRAPQAIGLVLIALAASGSVVLVDFVAPVLGVGRAVTGALARIDFYDVLMNGMLSFLLFAGALHADFAALLRRKWAIGLLATVGVAMSTVLIGATMWALLGAMGLAIPFIWALLFGALISPTDPVAVLGVLKTVKLPKSLEATIAGEALFNDGVGVVVFTILLAVAAGAAPLGALDVAELFVTEALGGAVLGMVAGYLAYRAMRGIDEHNLEVVISLALVTMTYAIAHRIGVSGPIAVVVAGLFIGNRGVRFAMSEKTRDYLLKFWSLTDEILNSVLFLLIGLEVLVLRFSVGYAAAALLAIPVVLLARWISVAAPTALISLWQPFGKGAVPVLTWGGLRGGISVALALSLPESDMKAPILVITYGVVVFSIVVQGLTIKRVAARTAD